MQVGDTMSTLRDVQYIRGYHEYIGGYHEYIGVFNRNWKNLSSCSPKCIMISLWCAEHPPMYSWYPPPPPPSVLMISLPSNVLMVFLRCIEHPPMYTWYPPTFIMISPDVLNIPQFTEHTLYKENILLMNSLTYLKHYCDIFVATMVTISEQQQYIWKQRKLFCVKILLLFGKNIYPNLNNIDYLTHWVIISRLKVYQSWFTSSLWFLLLR